MGCGGSKATNATNATEEKKFEKTIANAPAEKSTGDAAAGAQPWVSAVQPGGVFNIFIDVLGQCIALDDAKKLRVVDVYGGPIGQWNNRQRTEKVRLGDLVMKVRKAGVDDKGPVDNQWVADDTAAMMSLLETTGLSEVQLKREEAPAEDENKPSTSNEKPAGDVIPQSDKPADTKDSEPANTSTQGSGKPADTTDPEPKKNVDGENQNNGEEVTTTEAQDDNKGACGFCGM